MENVNVVLLVIQGLFAIVMFLFGNTLRAMREDIKDSSKSIASLATMLAAKDAESLHTFVTKEEAGPRWDRLHDVNQRVTVLETRAGMFSRGASD